MTTRPFTPAAWELDAILAGQLTQLRRPVKQMLFRLPIEVMGRWYEVNYKGKPVIAAGEIKTPLGNVGNAVWVKEKCWIDYYPAGVTVNNQLGHVHYKANHPYPEIAADLTKKALWQPADTMPQWASRLTRRVTGVRVKQLRAVSHEDVDAMGVPSFPDQMIWRGDYYQRLKDFEYW